MKKVILAVAILVASTAGVYAQGGKGHGGMRDPKKMSERIAEKLEFTDAQKEQVATLNDKYSGDDYDKEKYRAEFKEIMTEEQKAKAQEMRKNHQRRK